MTREEARKAAQVMQAYADGAEIEFANVRSDDERRSYLRLTHPSFDWSEYNYRVKQTPDFIEWSHVAPEYKWMARDKGGDAYLFAKRPHVLGCMWRARDDDDVKGEIVSPFKSYKHGTVDWEDSLVSREEWEAEQ